MDFFKPTDPDLSHMIKAIQRKFKIAVDGSQGPQTLATIYEALGCAEYPYTFTAYGADVTVMYPDQLRVANGEGKSITNFFQGTSGQYNNGKQIGSMAINQGKVIYDQACHAWMHTVGRKAYPEGVLYLTRDGKVLYERVAYLRELKTPLSAILWLVGGCSGGRNFNPDAEGFSRHVCSDGKIRDYTDVFRAARRVSIFYKDGMMYKIAHPFITMQGLDTLLIGKFGADPGRIIHLDGGTPYAKNLTKASGTKSVANASYPQKAVLYCEK